MKVLGAALVARFALRHPVSKKPLQRFLEIARSADWPHFPAIKKGFAFADYISSGFIIFDIGGNKYRLLATIDFAQQILLIERVYTHDEYSREEI